MTPKTFVVEVDDIGQFEFKRRNTQMGIQIGVEFSKLTGGYAQLSEWVINIAMMVATIKACTASAPADWDIDDMDVMSEQDSRLIAKVYQALEQKEAFFRTQRKGYQGQGQGRMREDSLVVSEEVQSAGS